MVLRFCLLFFLFSLEARAQLTLVESAPNDSFDLSQTRFALAITDFAVTRGQFSVPMNLQKPVATNLLHWRYFDNISGENVVTRHEPVWVEARTQLLHTVPDSMMLSLHINLECADTTIAERKHQIFMVIAGLTKADLLEMPLTAFFKPIPTHRAASPPSCKWHSSTTKPRRSIASKALARSTALT